MPDDFEPCDSPVTELAAQAALHHEVFLAWIEAGFTEKQALELLKALITASRSEGGE
ncbi:hypothetical protein [Streptomyces sp. NPDC051452]|uniref:hypothetical protein n=1 Tax=Streptomyces sp. NPDC051452 TaxID=3365654 RepID=UPI0037A8A34B